jgi:hypothetical protein
VHSEIKKITELDTKQMVNWQRKLLFKNQY